MRGRNGAPSLGAKAMEMHRIGCIGEMAVAAHLGLDESIYSDVSPNRKRTDLPGRIEVKTRAKHHYDLLVQLDDSADKLYVLVTYEAGEARLAGWIDGSEVSSKGSVVEYVRGRRCRAVRQSSLNDPALLIAEIQARLSKEHSGDS